MWSPCKAQETQNGFIIQRQRRGMNGSVCSQWIYTDDPHVLFKIFHLRRQSGSEFFELHLLGISPCLFKNLMSTIVCMALVSGMDTTKGKKKCPSLSGTQTKIGPHQRDHHTNQKRLVTKILPKLDGSTVYFPHLTVGGMRKRAQDGILSGRVLGGGEKPGHVTHLTAELCFQCFFQKLQNSTGSTNN